MGRVIFMLLTIVLFLPAGTFAQVAGQASDQEGKKQEETKKYLYQWTDDHGVVHITDGLGKVPKRFRPKAHRLREAPEGEEPEGRPSSEVSSPSFDYSEEEAIEADRKADWQQRVRMAKQRLSSAERRYEELKQKRDNLLGSWGGPASGRLKEREEAGRIEQEMNKVQKEIADARNQLEVVIPEEARKAGVPPGWLRE